MAAHPDKLARAILAREEHERADRLDLEALWQRIALYNIPRRATFTDEVSRGVQRNRFVLDSTAPRSLELFASFLHTLLNNPATQWFKISVEDDAELNKNQEVRKWMEKVQRIMLRTMSSQSANLYPQLYQIYIDLGAFGTAILYVETDDAGRLQLRAYHLADCLITTNSSGFVDGMYRQFKLSPRQAKQRWPDRPLGRQVDEALTKGGKNTLKEVRFIHAVFSRDDEELAPLVPKRIMNRGTPFISVWINAIDRKTIGTGTYEEFPYMVPRWYTVRGDKYGRSPAMTVLPSVQMVNRMKETILRGAEKLVDPPLLLPDGGLVSPIRLFPGGISFSEGVVEPKPLIPPGASRIEVGNDLLQKEQEAIREGYFVNLFQTPGSPVKTATQVLEEVDERNRAVSPMLINTQSELFHPFINRVFNILMRAGKFPEMPAVLEDVAIDIEYVSPLAASQQQMEGLSVLRLFQGLAPWSEIDPGIFDNFDMDEVAKVVHKASGAPASILRPTAKIVDIRKARTERQAADRAAGQAFEGAQAVAKLLAAQSKGQKVA